VNRHAGRRPGRRGGGRPTFLKNIRAPRVFWGVIAILAVIPLAMLYQRLFATGISTFVHWLLTRG
jgi:hypothetical protein